MTMAEAEFGLFFFFKHKAYNSMQKNALTMKENRLRE